MRLAWGLTELTLQGALHGAWHMVLILFLALGGESLHYQGRPSTQDPAEQLGWGPSLASICGLGEAQTLAWSDVGQ